MSQRIGWKVAGSFAAVALVSALAMGCEATVAAEPPHVAGYATVYAGTVPPDIYDQPHVYYNGGYAYYVNDQWYYPTQSGWVVFRDEPVELHRYRASYRARGYQQRPYVQRQRPYVQEAPPAVQVR